ncbi:uncharacterized protein [Clytia hemisphaerica]|uniref:RCC1-like domain-containing protein n=1 Tax=Clytia hemisphaerica TaxID=252671 RepID=A0A7M6DP20_9CNID
MLLTWGLSKNGQAGPSTNDKVLVPQNIPIKKQYGQIIDISAGGLFTGALTNKNYLISFGCGKYGRLGCGDENDHTKVISNLISSNSKLAKISCGLWHAAAIDNNGSLYIWGHLKACGTSSNMTQPSLVDLNKNVIGISCGFNYTLAWTIEGVAYSWGSGNNGVLGHGDMAQQKKPKIIEALNGHKIVDMSAGYCHCTAICEDGKLFTWGKAAFGSLGNGSTSKSDVLVPQLVTGFQNAKQSSCSMGENHGHTLVVNKSGTVFVTGDGYKGKLGLGDQESHTTFQEIPGESFGGEAIMQVMAGGISSAALSSKGHVFTWGCGSDGRLGHPEAEGHRYLFRSDQPRIVESIQDMNCKKVSASYYHMAALID